MPIFFGVERRQYDTIEDRDPDRSVRLRFGSAVPGAGEGHESDGESDEQTTSGYAGLHEKRLLHVESEYICGVRRVSKDDALRLVNVAVRW